MADNPGIVVPRATPPTLTPAGWSDGSFNFTRPGTVLPSFVPPIIGYHEPLVEEGGLGDGGRQSSIIKLPLTRADNAYGFGTNGGILINYSFYQNFWKDAVHIVPVPPVIDSISGWQAFGDGIIFDAGNVLSTVDFTYEMYNAADTKLAINTARTLVDLVGVNEIGPPGLPTDFGGKVSRSYVVEVTTTGPAVINGRIDHDFVNPEFLPQGTPLKLRIIGNRLLLFAFEPQRGVIERWDWVTDVLQAQDGAEQRFSLRQLPRQSFGFVYTFNEETVNRKLENFLRAFGTLQIGVPDWISLTELAAPILIDDSTATVVSTTNRDFRNDGLNQDGVVVFDSEDSFEAQTIQSFTSTVITVVNRFLQAWPVGQTVMPYKVAYLGDNWRQRLHRTDRREMTLTFDITDGADFSDESSFPTYKGRPLFDDLLGLGSATTYQQTWQWNMIQTGGKTSRQSRRTLRRFPKVTKTYVLPWDNRSEFVRARNWLFSRRGRQKDFWLPSWRDDLQVVDIGGALNELRVVKALYQNVFDKGFLIDIRVKYTDGTIDLRAITAVDDTNPAYDLLTPDTNFSQITSPTSVAQIEFLTLHRLNQDFAQIDHEWVEQGGDEMTGETFVEVIEIIE